jgi:glutaredoxin
MQNKKILTLISLLTIIILMGAIVITGGAFQENEANNNTGDKSVLSNSTTESNFDVGEETIVIFSSLACSFCKDVEEWVEENKADEMLDLQIKEVSQNQQYADQLTQAAIDCGIDSRRVGVPFMYAHGECFIGKIDIIEYLQLQLSVEQSQENGAREELDTESSNEMETDNELKIQDENFIED